MSYNLVDSTTGALTRVAGRGKAEYGASSVRSGTYMPSSSVQVQEDLAFSVTFSEPMPDNDYQVIFGSSSYDASSGTIQCVVRSRSTTGFTGIIRNVGMTEVSAASGTFTWFAFKLYSDVEYSNIVNSMPSDASASNKLVTESDTYNLYYPSFELYNSWADFLELLHQQGNGRYCGKAYLGSKWYSYIATITVQTSSWNGTALFMKEVDGEIVEAFKPASSSNVWTVKQVFSSANDDSSPVDISSSFTPESWVTNLSVTAMRKGNVVSLYIECEGTLNDSSMGTMQICSGDLPTKYRPLVEQSCSTSGYRGSLNSGYVEGRLSLSQNGHFALGEHFMVNATGGTYIFKWSLTYLV